MKALEPLKLLGKEWPVDVPPQFAVREELVVAYSDARPSFSARQRVCAAVIGLCTGIGKEAKFDYVRARFDVLAYGGAVYGWLREQGVSMADVAAAGTPIIAHIEQLLFPSEAEVAAEANFTPPPAPPTAQL